MVVAFIVLNVKSNKYLSLAFSIYQLSTEWGVIWMHIVAHYALSLATMHS